MVLELTPNLVSEQVFLLVLGVARIAPHSARIGVGCLTGRSWIRSPAPYLPCGMESRSPGAGPDPGGWVGVGVFHLDMRICGFRLLAPGAGTAQAGLRQRASSVERQADRGGGAGGEGGGGGAAGRPGVEPGSEEEAGALGQEGGGRRRA